MSERPKFRISKDLTTSQRRGRPALPSPPKRVHQIAELGNEGPSQRPRLPASPPRRKERSGD